MTQRAIFRCAQRAAARMVRGSSPSGRMMRFDHSTGTLGDSIAKCRRRHSRFHRDGGAGSDPVRVDVERHVVHPELDAFEIVFRHFGVHPVEVGRCLPAVGLHAQDGQTRFEPRLAKIPHWLVHFEFTCENQPGDRRFQRCEGDCHQNIAAIDRSDQNGPRLERVQHVGHRAREQGDFFGPAGLDLTFVQHPGAQVASDIDGPAGCKLGI